MYVLQAIALDRGPLAFSTFLLRNPGPLAPDRENCVTEAQDATISSGPMIDGLEPVSVGELVKQ